MNYENAKIFYTEAGKFSHEPGLSAMRELCRTLGHPEDKLRFVHIAGTNGKGSCAAMVSSMLRCAGYKTGLFTSPDLVDFSERMQVNGVNITHDDIAHLTEQIAAVTLSLPRLSFFELVTALGFLYFAEQECDIVVQECGLGGLYDATNVVKNTETSVLMPVALDHTKLLGNTLSEIAREKAGILRAGVPAVCAVQEPEAMAVIQQRAVELNAPLHSVDINYIQSLSDSLDGQRFRYKHHQNLSLPLLGPHQLQNAAAALECADILGLSEETIRRGLAETVWPCRLERVKDFIIDGAHNPHGARALAEGLTHYFPGQKFCFVMGVMADKDVEGVLSYIKPLARHIYCVTAPSERALPAEDLAKLAAPISAEACKTPEEAIEKARASALPCCACGSLYFVGLLRQKLLEIAM